MNPRVLEKYLGKIVRLTLVNGFYFKGKVIDVDKTSLSLIDIRNNNVTLSPENIILIEDAKDGSKIMDEINGN